MTGPPHMLKLAYGFGPDEVLSWYTPDLSGGPLRPPEGWSTNDPMTRADVQGLRAGIGTQRLTPQGLPGPQDVHDLAHFSDQLSCRLVDERVRREVASSAQNAGANANDPLVLMLEGEDSDLYPLPLETMSWATAEVPACLMDNLILVRRSPSKQGRPLVFDADVRALVMVNDHANSSAIRQAKKLEQKLESSARSSVRLLTNETWESVQAKLADADYNVIVYVGHIEYQLPEEQALSLGPRSDRQGYMTFNGRAPGQEQPIHPATVAKAFGALPDLRCVLLLGCSTWETAAREFIDAGVPVVIGSHYMIDPCEIGVWGAHEFLQELAVTGRVDKAFLALRRGMVEGATRCHLGKRAGDQLTTTELERLTHYRARPALHLFGDNVRMLADETEEDGRQLISRIQYARAIRQRFATIDLPAVADDWAGEPRRKRETCQLSRQLTAEQKPAAATDDRGSQRDRFSSMEEEDRPGLKREKPRIELRESELLARLTSGGPVKHFGLTGMAGAGKTTTLQGLAYAAAKRFLADPLGSPLPIFVSLRGKRSPARALVQEEIRQRVSTGAGRPSKNDAAMVFDVAPESTVLLFDGLDEARIQDSPKWAQAFLPGAALAGFRSVIASRPEAMGDYGLPHFTEQNGSREHIFEFKPLEPRQVEQFVQGFFGADQELAKHVLSVIAANTALATELGHPFMLTLLCLLHEAGPIKTAPGTATELLDGAVRNLAQRRNREDISLRRHIQEPHIELVAVVAFAEQVALATGSQLDRDGAIQAIHNVIRKRKSLKKQLEAYSGPRKADALWGLLVKQTGLLYDGGNSVGVRDVRVREFLAAKHLAGLANDTDIAWDPKGKAGHCIITRRCDGTQREETVAAFVSRTAWDEQRWGQTTVHLGGLLTDPTTLLEELASEEPTEHNPYGDDWLRHRLGLACRCLVSARARIQPDEFEVLSSRIAGAAWGVGQPEGSFDGWAEVACGGVLGTLAVLDPYLVDAKARLFDHLADLIERGDVGSKAIAARAVQGLGVVGARHPRLPHRLADLMEWGDEDTKWFAAEAVQDFGAEGVRHPRLPDLLADLIERGDRCTKIAAAEAVQGFGVEGARHPRLPDRLADLMERGDEDTKRHAADAVKGFGVEGARHPRLPELLADLIERGDEDTKNAAAWAVEGFGMECARHHPKLLDRLADLIERGDYWTKRAAAWVVRGFGVEGARHPRLPHRLADLMERGDEDTKRHAADAVLGFGIEGVRHARLPDHLADLIEWGDEVTERYAAAAVRSLGVEGARHPRLPDLLVDLIEWGDYWTKQGAAEAVKGFGVEGVRHPRVPDLLADLIERGDWHTKLAAARAVHGFGVEGARHLRLPGRLADLIDRGDRDTKLAAAWAVQGFGVDWARHPPLPDLLADLIERGDWWTKLAAAEAVGGFGAECARHPRLADRLADLMERGDEDTKRFAARAVYGFGVEGARHQRLPHRLADLIERGGEGTEEYAAEAVQGFGASVVGFPRILDAIIIADWERDAIASFASAGVRWRPGSWYRTVGSLAAGDTAG